MIRMSFEVDSEALRKVAEEFEKELERVSKEYDELLERAVKWTAEEMKRQAPVYTGRLRESITWYMTEDFAFVEVWHPAVYWIEFGALPSVGAFQPLLGRRLRYGRHPGTRPSHFLLRTFLALDTYLERQLYRLFRR